MPLHRQLGGLLLPAMQIVVLALSATHPALAADGIPESLPPTHVQIDRAISLSGGYLERTCDPDGKFVYEIDINTGKQSPSYNIIRHAGAIYALGMLNSYAPDRKVVDAMVRAAAFMRRNYIRPGIGSNQLAVWSEPTGSPSDADLGATGLGLVALTETHKVASNSVTLEELQALGRFVLFLQNEDGSFVQKYRSGIGPVRHFQSPYYPGEAILGLISLYQTDHSREWLRAAGKSLSYLAKNLPRPFDGQLDQWALIAIARLLPYCDMELCAGASRKELVQYAVRVSDWIAHQQLRNPTSPLNGAFDPQGEAAPAAARSEGLLAALEFLPDEQLRRRIEACTQRSMEFLLRLQIESGRFAGGLRRALRTSATGSAEVRIDYVQHALCAWLRYQKAAQP
jgi:hypothetical protein